MRHLIEEILGSGLNLDPNRHIEEVRRIGKRASGKFRPVCIRPNRIGGKQSGDPPASKAAEGSCGLQEGIHHS